MWNVSTKNKRYQKVAKPEVILSQTERKNRTSTHALIGPQVLILQLKRFGARMRPSKAKITFQPDKNTTHIHFEETLSLDDFITG